MKMIRSVAILLLVVLPLLSTPLAASPLALFDEGHAQPFLSDSDAPLGLSRLAALLSENGFAVRNAPDGLTPQVLAEADLLIVSGPFRPFARQELDAVMDYLAQGGGLLVMLHVAPPVRALLDRLDVDYSNGTLREEQHVIGQNALDFKVVRLEEHPALGDVKSFSVFGAWALRGTAGHVGVLARTSAESWVDLNGDRRLSAGDAVQSLGVLVAGETGRGRYIVIGDDALFQNRFLNDDNRALAVALARWTTRR